MRWKTRIGVLTAGAVLALTAACATPSQDAPEPSASVEAPAVQDATATPATPAPDEATVAAPVTGQGPLITGTGIGQIEVGMPLEDVIAMDELGIDPDAMPEWCPVVVGDMGGVMFVAAATPVEFSPPIYGVWIYDENGPVVSVPTTAAGAGLGTGVDELTELHPDGVWGTIPEDFPTMDFIEAKYVVTVDGGPVAFGIAEDRVRVVAAGSEVFPADWCG